MGRDEWINQAASVYEAESGLCPSDARAFAVSLSEVHCVGPSDCWYPPVDAALEDIEANS